MLVIVLVICALGVVQIFSAAHGTPWQDAWWKQIMWVGAGLLLMWVASAIDYHSLMQHITALYLLSVALLVTVLLIGKQAWGATRWIPLAPGFHLQVSEFVKLVIILLVARYMTELHSDTLEIREMLKVLGLIVRTDAADHQGTRSGNGPHVSPDSGGGRVSGGPELAVSGRRGGYRGFSFARWHSLSCSRIRRLVW